MSHKLWVVMTNSRDVSTVTSVLKNLDQSVNCIFTCEICIRMRQRHLYFTSQAVMKFWKHVEYQNVDRYSKQSTKENNTKKNLNIFDANHAELDFSRHWNCQNIVGKICAKVLYFYKLGREGILLFRAYLQQVWHHLFQWWTSQAIQESCQT